MEALRHLRPELVANEVLLTVEEVLTRKPEASQFLELRPARIITAAGSPYLVLLLLFYEVDPTVMCAYQSPVAHPRQVMTRYKGADSTGWRLRLLHARLAASASDLPRCPYGLAKRGCRRRSR